MPYIALKGWNFQTQVFDTLEEYFDPRKNPNYALNSSAPLRSWITALNKIVPRSLLVEMTQPYIVGEADACVELWNRLLLDEEIPLLRLLTLFIESTGYNEDDEEDGEYLKVATEIPYIHSGSLGNYYVSRHISLESGLSSDEIYQEAKDLLLSTPLNPPYEFNLDSSDIILSYNNFTFTSASLRAVVLHHFYVTRYGRIDRFSEGGEVIDDETRGQYSPQDVGYSMGRNDTVTIHNWNIITHHPEFFWTRPVEGSSRRQLHKILQYSTNVTRYIPGPLREDGEYTENLYGVELELATSASVQDIVDATPKLYCICKHDTTVSGNKANKVELVTGPASIKHHKKNLAQILEKVGYDKFDVTRNTTNGMHIHVDLNAFNNKDGITDATHQKHFVWFFTNPINRPFQEVMSERDTNSMKQYAAPPPFPKGQSLPVLYRTVLNYIMPPNRGIITLKQNRDTGQFITIEVRAFKGIVSLAAIWKNLEYVDSVFNFTTKTNYRANSLDNYLQYLGSTQSNRYTVLKEFLERSDIGRIRDTAALQGMVWGQEDPHRVVAILEKNEFPVKQHHIETLNNLIANAKFSLNEKGTLRVLETNRSKLYDLDSSLHARMARRTTANVSNPRP
jgi:hypothetical protein